MNIQAGLISAARKISALSILAALAAGVTFGIVLPVWERFHELDEKISVQRQLLGRYLSASTAASTPGSDATQVNQTVADQAYLLGETDALRLANLQAILNEVSAAQKMRFASTRAMDAAEQSGVRLLGLQAQLSTELAPLQNMLFDLEKRQKNMIVDGLHITRAPESAAANVPSLDVSFVLLGAAPKKKE
jgi:Type II secretion system (T2SS), protein M subtype b